MNPFTPVAIVNLLAAFSLRAAAVICLAALAALAMRRAPAAARHAVWASCLAAVLLLPALSVVLPPIRVGVPMAAKPVMAKPTAAFVPAIPAAPQVETRSSTAWRQEVQGTAGVPQSRIDAADRKASAPTATMPETQQPRLYNAMVSWRQAVILIWLAGLLLTLGRLGRASLALRRLARRSRPFETDEAKVTDATVRVADVSVPMTFGLRRPVILLPLEAGSWPHGRIAAAIRHEMAHVRRADWTLQLIARFVCALYWFHPLVWLAEGRMRAEAERASDDLALADGGMDAPDYAAHLIAIARCARSCPAASVAAAMAQQSKIEGRVRAILAHVGDARRVSRKAVIGINALVAMLALAIFTVELVANTPSMGSQSYMRTIPGLTDVRIVAFVDPNKPSIWWTVDGKRLTNRIPRWPFVNLDSRPKTGTPSSSIFDQGRSFGLVLRMKNLGTLSDPEFSVDGATELMTGVYPNADKTTSYAIYGRLPLQQQTYTLHIKQPSNWHDAAAWRPSSTNRFDSNTWIAARHDASIDPALNIQQQDPGRPRVRSGVHAFEVGVTQLNAQTAQECRLVVVHRTGAATVYKQCSGVTNGRTLTSIFPLSIASTRNVREVQFKTGPTSVINIADFAGIQVKPTLTSGSPVASPKLKADSGFVASAQVASQKMYALQCGFYNGDVQPAAAGTARFSNDVSIQIGGIASLAGSVDNLVAAGWWSRSGSAIAPQFAWPSTGKNDKFSVQTGDRRIGFDVVMNTPRRQYAALRWLIIPSESALPAATIGTNAPDTPYLQSLRMRYAISALVPASARTATVRVAVPDDTYRNLYDWVAGSANASSAATWIPQQPSAPVLRFGSASGGRTVTVSIRNPASLRDWQFTADVIDGAGKTKSVPLYLNEVSLQKTLMRITASATVPIDRIQSIHLQMQVVHWQDIQGVPLYPRDVSSMAAGDNASMDAPANSVPIVLQGGYRPISASTVAYDSVGNPGPPAAPDAALMNRMSNVGVAGATDLRSANGPWWYAGRIQTSPIGSWPPVKQISSIHVAPGERKIGFDVLLNTPRRASSTLLWSVLVSGKPVKTFAIGQITPAIPTMRWVQSFSLISAIVPKSAQSCTLQVALKSNQAGDEHNIKWQEIRNVSLYPQGGGRAM